VVTNIEYSPLQLICYIDQSTNPVFLLLFGSLVDLLLGTLIVKFQPWGSKSYSDMRFKKPQYLGNAYAVNNYGSIYKYMVYLVYVQE
jgi:hypothetical protein